MQVIMGFYTPVKIGQSLACIYARRFTEFDANPKTATPRDTITVSGKLEYHATPLCWWQPAGGDNVELYIDGVKKAEANTESDGTFRFSIPASQLGYGNHVIWCVAPEFWRGCYAKSSEVTVSVVTEEEKKKIEQQQQTMELLKWLVIGGAVAVAATIGFMVYEREKRMEMIRLMLMMRK
jgi:hypothetical protein